MSEPNQRTSIDGVVVLSLKVIEDDRGAVLHMLRADWPLFSAFGEVYFSEIKPGIFKGWKRHLRTTQHLAVPVGAVKFVLYDDRTQSRSRGCIQQAELGRRTAYRLLVIPPGVWYGWKCLVDHPSLVANCINEPHDPGEVEVTSHLIDLESLQF
jgi:dTDP-4-dehydrorhamnose 3,5-epimerase